MCGVVDVGFHAQVGSAGLANPRWHFAGTDGSGRVGMAFLLQSQGRVGHTGRVERATTLHGRLELCALGVDLTLVADAGVVFGS